MLGAAVEVHMERVPNYFHLRAFSGGFTDSVGKFQSSTMNEDASWFEASFIVNVPHVAAKLLYVVRGWRALFAFDDHGSLVAVDQQDVAACAILKDLLPDLFVGVRQQSVLEFVWVRGDVTLESTLVVEMCIQPDPVGGVVHDAPQLG